MENKNYARWTLHGQHGIDSLVLDHPPTISLQELSDDYVLVKIHAASLNYKDLRIASGTPGLAFKDGVVPVSDGAGVVVAVGSSVKEFKSGDRVVTHIAPHVDEEQLPGFGDATKGLGLSLDGTLQEFGVYPESTLIPMPKNLSFEQAATLSCSALTAWNALFGIESKKITKGSWVLVQGTGGVSIAALQFARAVGASVVATTGSAEKVERVQKLGAEEVINYREDHDWDQTAKNVTPHGRGFDHIAEVGGNSTLAKSLKSVRTDGVISSTGFLGPSADGKDPLIVEILFHVCIVRGVLLGSKKQFRDMVRFIEEFDVQLAVDDIVFSLDQAKEAYRRLQEQKHFAKVVIKIA